MQQEVIRKEGVLQQMKIYGKHLLFEKMSAQKCKRFPIANAKEAFKSLSKSYKALIRFRFSMRVQKS